MITKDLQTWNLKFDQAMFNSLVLTLERNFEVTFGIFSVLVFQINVLESYLSVLKLPVDPCVTNRPIIFRLTARTDDPKYLANSQVIPQSPS